jgi:hypothetical protein
MNIVYIVDVLASGWDGSRVGLGVQLSDSAATTLSGNYSKVAASVIAISSFNQGGVSAGFGTTQFGRGSNFGAVFSTRLDGGATWLGGQTGAEIDVQASAGSSLSAQVGLQIVHQGAHAVQGTNTDAAFRIGDQVSALIGWKNLITLGSYDSQWPTDPNGYLIQSQNGANYASVAAAAAGGVDLLETAFTGVGRSGGGFAFRTSGPSGVVGATAIDGTGGIKVGAGYISANTAGLIIDAPLFIFSSVGSIVSGGTNFASGDLVNDGFGNIFSVTATAGVVSALTLKYRAEGRPAAPTGTITCKALVRIGAAVGSGLQITETWTQATALSIQPSGGATTVGGTLGVTGGATVGGNLTVGANLIVFLAGTTAAGFTSLVGRLDGVNTFAMHGDANWGCILQGLSGNNADLALFSRSGTPQFRILSSGLIQQTSTQFTGTTGFNNTAPVAKPSISGSRGGNAALASLLTALAAYGLVTDTTTA